MRESTPPYVHYFQNGSYQVIIGHNSSVHNVATKIAWIFFLEDENTCKLFVLSMRANSASHDSLLLDCLKVGAHEGTSPCNNSRGRVPSCELTIFASKSSRRDQLWSLRLVSPTKSNQFEQVPANCSSKRFVWIVRGTSPCDQCLRVNSS